MLNGLRHDLQPEGTLEQILVEKLAALSWRYRRLLIAEAAEIRKGAEFVEWDEKQRLEKEAHSFTRIGIDQEGGLIQKMTNPEVLQRCLDLLEDLKNNIESDGLDREADEQILTKLYGGSQREYWGKTLFDAYGSRFITRFVQMRSASKVDTRPRRNQQPTSSSC